MGKNYVKNYKITRSNLLLMLALTLINVVFVFFESDTMMLFSATVPYIIGLYLGEYIFYIFALVPMFLYLLCWFFSKKHYGWMILKLFYLYLIQLFVIYLYIPDFDVSVILDIDIHGWVLYYLFLGYVIEKN